MAGANSLNPMDLPLQLPSSLAPKCSVSLEVWSPVLKLYRTLHKPAKNNNNPQVITNCCGPVANSCCHCLWVITPKRGMRVPCIQVPAIPKGNLQQVRLRAWKEVGYAHPFLTLVFPYRSEAGSDGSLYCGMFLLLKLQPSEGMGQTMLPLLL